LILLKSKSLLAKISLDGDDKADIDELKERLKVLSIFRSASANIKNIFAINILYRQKNKKNVVIEFQPDEKLNLKNILLSLDGLIERNKFVPKIPEKKVQKQKSLREITEEITKKIEKYIKISFKELVLTADRKEVSASFISVLEMFRNNFVDLRQNEDFGEIMIEKQEFNEVIYKEN
jgi:chromatin segregation and condensation protein Rec8/ScpA/Scc1 (kleisin family)